MPDDGAPRSGAMTGWNAAYDLGPPPWDIGRAQPAVLRLADRGAFRSTLLDAGCGTGENALAIARRGIEVVGLDGSSSAIRLAREKLGRGNSGADLPLTFVVGDALDLTSLGRRFGSVLDCGLFHTFDDDERLRYVDRLRSVLGPGSVLSLLCFSDEEPWGGGPRRISQREIRVVFADGWDIRSIEPERFETRFHGAGARAWLATIVRTESQPLDAPPPDSQPAVRSSGRPPPP